MFELTNEPKTNETKPGSESLRGRRTTIIARAGEDQGGGKMMRTNFNADAWRPLPKSWRKKRATAPQEKLEDFRYRLRTMLGPAPRTKLQKLLIRGPNDRGFHPPQRKAT